MRYYFSISGALLAVALLLGACGRPATTAPVPKPTAMAAIPASVTAAPTAAQAVGGEAGGEAGGIEAALVTYADPSGSYAIGHPGPWTQDTTFADGVRFNGGDESMALSFVTPPAGSSAADYAAQDAVALSAIIPGFAKVGIAPSTEVDRAIVLGFTADGTSAVTGKAFGARGDRYYIPVAGGRIAVLTVSAPASRYDREGVRDIALTLKVLQ